MKNEILEIRVFIAPDIHVFVTFVSQWNPVNKITPLCFFFYYRKRFENTQRHRVPRPLACRSSPMSVRRSNVLYLGPSLQAHGCWKRPVWRPALLTMLKSRKCRLPWVDGTAPAGARGEKMNEEIDECNRKGNRRKRARVEAEKARENESDVDREMKGD